MSHDLETLVKVESVSKKFCRSLKKSLWYGVQDILSDLNPFRRDGTPSSPRSLEQITMPGASMGPASSRLRADEFWAVNDVSVELRRGECLGLIGHNGAGKTTLLKMLNGLLKPDRGRMLMRGRVGALIALGAGFNPILTGRENIYVNGAVLGLKKREIRSKLDEIIDFADLREFIDAPVQGYSSGMAVRLGFAIASACQPDVLLLDEVLAVGDMAFQTKCFNRLGEIRRNGTGFILVAHNMHQITRFCDRVLYMRKGKAEFYGPTESGVELFLKEMASHGEVKEPEMAGSMTVTIRDAHFVNISGDRVSEIASGDPVRLVIEYHCKVDQVIDPVLEVILRDSNGEALYHGSNRMSKASLGELRDSGTLVVSFPPLPANNQQLVTSMSLWDSGMHELICWRRGLRLSINGNPRSTGRILLDCEWQNLSLSRECPSLAR
jgi:lipopolysaccharide transport system ATP-binding protein